MLELHSNVPHILKIPATKEVATSKGTLEVCMQIRLHTIRTMQHVSSDTLELNRNFRRNMMANVRDIPTREA